MQFKHVDGLPETICQRCECRIVETLSFIHRTKDNQQILHSCARHHTTKTEVEDNANDDSTYLIEVLNEDGDAISQDDCDSQQFKPEDDNYDTTNDEQNDDTEDAVSFLKNVKRDDVGCDSRNTFPMKKTKKNHSCNFCKKRFLRKSNLVDHLRLHANVSHCLLVLKRKL